MISFLRSCLKLEEFARGISHHYRGYTVTEGWGACQGQGLEGAQHVHGPWHGEPHQYCFSHLYQNARNQGRQTDKKNEQKQAPRESRDIGKSTMSCTSKTMAIILAPKSCLKVLWIVRVPSHHYRGYTLQFCWYLSVCVSVVEDLVETLSWRISSTDGGLLGPDLTSLMSVTRQNWSTITWRLGWLSMSNPSAVE